MSVAFYTPIPSELRPAHVPNPFWSPQPDPLAYYENGLWHMSLANLHQMGVDVQHPDDKELIKVNGQIGIRNRHHGIKMRRSSKRRSSKRRSSKRRSNKR